MTVIFAVCLHHAYSVSVDLSAMVEVKVRQLFGEVWYIFTGVLIIPVKLILVLTEICAKIATFNYFLLFDLSHPFLVAGDFFLINYAQCTEGLERSKNKIDLVCVTLCVSSPRFDAGSDPLAEIKKLKKFSRLSRIAAAGIF